MFHVSEWTFFKCFEKFDIFFGKNNFAFLASQILIVFFIKIIKFKNNHNWIRFLSEFKICLLLQKIVLFTPKENNFINMTFYSAFCKKKRTVLISCLQRQLITSQQKLPTFGLKNFNRLVQFDGKFDSIWFMRKYLLCYRHFFRMVLFFISGGCYWANIRWLWKNNFNNLWS